MGNTLGGSAPHRGLAGLCVGLRRARVSAVRILGGERLGDALQRLALGLDAEKDLDHATGHHHRRADVVPHGDLGDVTGAGGVLDQGAEQQRPGDAPDRRPDGVEEGDAQGAGLHREDLAWP